MNSTAELNRTLGLWSLIAIGVGLVVSQGIMALMLQGVGIAGLGFIVPLGIAFVLGLTYVASFSELALMFPEKGGFSDYVEAGLGHFWSLFGSYSGYVIVALLALPTEVYLVDLMVDHIVPGVFPSKVLGITILLGFAILNVFGVDIFSKAQTIIAFSMVLALFLLGVFAVGDHGSSGVDISTVIDDWNPMGLEVFALVTMALWGFVGAEFICPLAGECKNPRRNIPMSMVLSISVIFIVYCFYCVGALLFVDREVLISEGLPHLYYAKSVLGNWGSYFICFTGLFAVCSTVNTTLAVVPRMLFRMAKNGEALGAFSTLHRSFKTPWVAILVMSILVSFVVLFMKPELINNMLISAALCWLVAYVIAHACVLVLRKKRPDIDRPFKTPLYPLPQIVGIAGMAYALCFAAPSPDMALQIYRNFLLIVVIVAVASFLWVKFVMKKKLFSVS